MTWLAVPIIESTSPEADVSMTAHATPSMVLSNTKDWVLNLIVPAPPALAAVLPCGSVTPPEPGNTASEASPVVTAPVEADTVVWFAVAAKLVTAPAEVTNVPDVGKVTFVAPVIVKVDANAPEVARFPASVNVDEPLFTPDPPLAPVSGAVNVKEANVGLLVVAMDCGRLKVTLPVADDAMTWLAVPNMELT